MIDIVRDYTAIGRGSTHAARARIRETVRLGTLRINGCAHPSGTRLPQEGEPTIAAGLAAVPTTLLANARCEFDRAVERLGLVTVTELRSLRSQVQGLERRVGDLRGDR